MKIHQPDTQSVPRLAAKKPIRLLSGSEEALLFDRSQALDPTVERDVATIIREVREGGDAALREHTRRYDEVSLETIEVNHEAGAAALEALDPAVRHALEGAAEAIYAFHYAQRPRPLEFEVRPGIRLERRSEPLQRVGVYAPGGRAAYPSSVLMGVVPARAAGVEDVIVATPAGPDGTPPPAVLAACVIAGADRVFAIGGASAIAAMAVGTESVPRVDKIVGPGNVYVTEAKRQLTGTVAIDCPAGPSEILVLADETADPELVALELLAQAEHDPDAAAVLVTTSEALAEAAGAALGRLLVDHPRRAIVERSLAANGAILTASSLGEALRFTRRYAPEHLALMVRDPRVVAGRVDSAGTVFLGDSSSVAFGDYTTGANHVLPTGGLARVYSGLSTLDFVRFTTIQEVSAEAGAQLAEPTAVLAEAEGLPGHALAARARGAARTTGTARVVGSNADSGTAHSTGSPRASTAPPPAPPLRAAYRVVPLYDPERRPIALDLSDNTSLFGPPPSAARVLAEMDGDELTRYPEVYADALKAKLATLHGVRSENIVTGCGLDDVIDSAIRAFGEPGDAVAYPDPTFGMIPTFTQMNALRPAAVPLVSDAETEFRLDVEGILATRAKITYLCQPNNPTGTLFARGSIEQIAAESSGIIFLDEAYADFAGESMTAWATESTRVIALRTLSKAWGLAGLRIGYAIGPAALVREIEKSRGPYKITAAADAAARAAIRNDQAVVSKNVEEACRNRERLRNELETLGLRVWRSAANFLLVSAPGGAAEFSGLIRGHGVAVRAFPDLPIAGECVRITVGPWSMMERLLEAVRAALEGGQP